MISVGLSKIIIDEKSQEQVVVLKEKSGRRSFPIVIGMNEALAIRMKLSNFLPPRPLTHDLMKVLLDSVNVSVEKVCIDKVIESTFHAKIHLKKSDGAIVAVDARPSDGIALALRCGCEIYVADEILENASFQ